MALRGQMAGVVTGLCDAFAPWRNLESRVSQYLFSQSAGSWPTGPRLFLVSPID